MDVEPPVCASDYLKKCAHWITVLYKRKTKSHNIIIFIFIMAVFVKMIINVHIEKLLYDIKYIILQMIWYILYIKWYLKRY